MIVLLKNAGAMTEKRIEAWESDAQIYTLRTHGVECKTIIDSHGLCRRAVFGAVRRHLGRKREVDRAREAQGINRDGPVQAPLSGDV